LALQAKKIILTFKKRYMYYLAKVKHTKIDEQSGNDKKVNEQYLFKAVNWTDAEKQAYAAFEQMAINNFELTYLNPYKIADVNHFETGDKRFKCSYELMLLDDATGKEKKTKVSSLVQADTVEEATERMHGILKDCVSDYTLGAVVDTPILEVFE
jgi:hypothetical protein